MDTIEIELDLPDSAETDELVVHLPHLDLVTDQLGHIGVGLAGDPEKDEELGLALVRLTAPPGGGTRDLDALLKQLRELSAAAYGKWVPLIGKNRHVDKIFVMPQPKPHTVPIAIGPLAAEDLAPLDGLPPSTAAPDAGRGIRVGVVDTKIYAHPDLIGRFIAEKDSIHGPLPEPSPRAAGHATFVTSLILSPAPAATVEVRNVIFDDDRPNAWTAVQNMMRLADSGVDIINMSVGCRTADGQPPLLLARAVELLGQRVLIVAAAGNQGALPGQFKTVPTWPAAIPDVVAVGARQNDGSKAPFSPELPWITCTAPGKDVSGDFLDALVEMPDDSVQKFTNYATWSGTSFATATVSGEIAARTVRGKVTPREALDQLLAETDGVVRKYVQGQDEPHAG
jgi:subtilisin family serine protease